MSSCVKKICLTAFVLALFAGLPVGALASPVYTASKPRLSATPIAGAPFTVSGVIKPKSTAASGAVVKIKLYMLMDGRYGVMDTYRAKLSRNPAGKPGTKYSCEMTIPMDGKHAVRAFHYRDGKLVERSKVSYFAVQMAVQTITVDPHSHAAVTVPASAVIDVVFPGTLTGCAASIAFTSSALVKTCSSPLTYHSDGLPAGRYDWACSMGPMCHGGTLVAQAAATGAKARVTYATSKPVLSGTPRMNKAFSASGLIKPKSTSSSRAKVKMILWMKSGSGYGVMSTYWATLSKRAGGTGYSLSLTIPMKGGHGLQAVQYRGGKKVSSSAIEYFTVKP